MLSRSACEVSPAEASVHTRDNRVAGYNPLPEAKTLAEQLVRRRTTLGMSQKEAAEEMGVDPATLARWERGEREPTGEMLDGVGRFLDGSKRAVVRRAG